MTSDEIIQLANNIKLINDRKNILTSIRNILVNNEQTYTDIRICLIYKTKGSLDRIIDIPLEDIEIIISTYIDNELLDIEVKKNETETDIGTLVLPIKLTNTLADRIK